MTDSIEKTCPECGQRMRIPRNVGGVVMACPECGKKFYSDFKVGGADENNGITAESIFEMPTSLLSKLSRLFRS